MLKFNLICWAIFLSMSERVLSSDSKFEKYYTAYIAAHQTGFSFFNLFEQCLEAIMPNQQFEIDDLKSFVNHPSKTTVGYAPKYTSNRKFFANLITSTAFKEMLAKDQEELKRALVRKMKYCDEVVMDQELLKDFYDREIDQ